MLTQARVCSPRNFFLRLCESRFGPSTYAASVAAADWRGAAACTRSGDRRKQKAQSAPAETVAALASKSQFVPETKAIVAR